MNDFLAVHYCHTDGCIVKINGLDKHCINCTLAQLREENKAITTKLEERQKECERLKATERVCRDVDCGDFEAAMLDWKFKAGQAEQKAESLQKELSAEKELTAIAYMDGAAEVQKKLDAVQGVVDAAVLMSKGHQVHPRHAIVQHNGSGPCVCLICEALQGADNERV